MDAARPLKEVFDSLTGDAGEPDGLTELISELPGDLLATAIDSYAQTAPAEVAEHLAPLLEDGSTDLNAVLGAFSTVPAVEEDEVQVEDLEPEPLDDAPPLDGPALDFGTGHVPAVDDDPSGVEPGVDEPDEQHEPFTLPDHDATPAFVEGPADDVHDLHLEPIALDDLDDGLDDGFDDLDG